MSRRRAQSRVPLAFLTGDGWVFKSLVGDNLGLSLKVFCSNAVASKAFATDRFLVSHLKQESIIKLDELKMLAIINLVFDLEKTQTSAAACAVSHNDP